jgi:phenylacetate-CoA ligase
MWMFLAGYAVYPIHERLLGRATFRFRRELEQSQWNSPDDLRTLQGDKLRRLMRHAQAHVSFYRQRFDEARVNVSADDPLEQLRRLPGLDKSEIRAALSAMLWHDAPGGLFPNNTGGSTGEPLTFYVDRRRQAYDQAARMRTHRWFGVRPGDREMYLWGSPIEKERNGRLKRFRDAMFNHRLLDAFNMSEARLDEYLEEWNRFRPVCLFGYPTSIVRFVEHARLRGRRLNRTCLRAVFVTGEVCFAHDRAVISEFFGVPVADGYGSRDAGFIAHECPRGRMHITAENIVVEILEDGVPVPRGGCGEIVITHLDAYGMPFIRYRTGDIGRLVDGRCACGRGLPMMDVVQGRCTDFLYLPDGNVRHALSIIYPLREIPGVGRFRVVQGEDHGVCVEVVCSDPSARLTTEAVAKRLRPVLGHDLALDVRVVDQIQPNAAGKHCYVVSHVRQTGSASRRGVIHA